MYDLSKLKFKIGDKIQLITSKYTIISIIIKKQETWYEITREENDAIYKEEVNWLEERAQLVKEPEKLEWESCHNDIYILVSNILNNGIQYKIRARINKCSFTRYSVIICKTGSHGSTYAEYLSLESAKEDAQRHYNGRVNNE